MNRTGTTVSLRPSAIELVKKIKIFPKNSKNKFGKSK